MKKALILGASGATGRLLVQLLLQKGLDVIAIVRNKDSLINMDCSNCSLKIVEAEISKMPDSELAKHLIECEVILSCLGHNITFKGLFGKPRKLVTDAIKKVTENIEHITSTKKFKIILMNTTGNSNRDIPEIPPLSQRIVVSMLRLLLPPQVDNEKAADFLRTKIGKSNSRIEWVVVRPDSLIDEEKVSKYNIYSSPIRNVIFDPGKTSRINVADFMSDLAAKNELWNKWKGKMPVIYNNV